MPCCSKLADEAHETWEDVSALTRFASLRESCWALLGKSGCPWEEDKVHIIAAEPRPAHGVEVSEPASPPSNLERAIAETVSALESGAECVCLLAHTGCGKTVLGTPAFASFL